MSLFIRINRSLGLPIRDVVCICTRNDIVSVSGSFLAIAFRITPPLVSIPADPSTASSSSHMLAYGPLDTKNVVLIDMDCVLLTTYINALPESFCLSYLDVLLRKAFSNSFHCCGWQSIRPSGQFGSFIKLY